MELRYTKGKAGERAPVRGNVVALRPGMDDARA
jgi:hypothetical protein